MLAALLTFEPALSAERDGFAGASGLFIIITALSVLLIVLAVLRRLLSGTRGAKALFSLSVGVGNALMDVASLLQPDRPAVESLEKSRSTGERAARSASVGDGRPPDQEDSRP